MAYHVHKTAGFVLAAFPSGEDNVFLHIFTEELGLVGATAQGARKLESKLRFGLQQYTFGQFSFVHGKISWRVTNAVPFANLFHLFRDDKRKLEICSQISMLLKRLLAGEEKNAGLFHLIRNAFSFLEHNSLSPEDLDYFEFLFVLRILHNLGYISVSPGLELLAQGAEWSGKAVSDISLHKKEAITAINRAILESQL